MAKIKPITLFKGSEEVLVEPGTRAEKSWRGRGFSEGQIESKSTVAKTQISPESAALRDRYFELFGKKAPSNWGEDTIAKKIAEAEGADDESDESDESDDSDESAGSDLPFDADGENEEGDE